MEFIKKRQNDPEYLKSVIVQREIVIDEEKRKLDQLSKQHQKLKAQYEDLGKQKTSKEEAANKEINNLSMAIQHLDSEIEIIKHEKNEFQFLLNNTRIKLQESQREHKSDLERVKIENDSQKEMLNNKIANLQKNLGELKKYYRVEQNIVDDKKKIVEDSNRDLKGFSNQKQERMLIIQNQQFKNQIQYQSKNITVQLQKNQKLLQQIKSLKIELQLHKDIEADLIKRSSLAQSLIKKLHKEIQQIRKNQGQTTVNSLPSTPSRSSEGSQRGELSSRASKNENKQKEQSINKLKFQLANLKNYNHYMENMQKIYSKKYETLGSLIADYLDNLLYSRQGNSSEGGIQANNEVVINIHELRDRDMKQWRFEQIEAVMQLLIAQIKPYLSKNSLIHFPQVRNVNISFVEQTPKEVISLPKLVDNYEKSYDKDAKKGQNRFKDIPIDISTKILRSNLRQWGSKVKYGNMPIVKAKSKSIMEENQKSFL